MSLKFNFNYIILLLIDNGKDMTTKDIGRQDFLLKSREQGQRYKVIGKHII